MVFDISNPFGTGKSNKIKKPANFKKTVWGVGSSPQPDWYPTPVNLGAGSSARIKQASKNKIKSMEWSVKHDPTIGYANKILGEMGKSPIKSIVKRRRKGRWSTSLSQEPTDVIKKYNRQKTLIDWGKKVGGLKLDPKRKVSVVDVHSTKQEAIYWTHNSRKRVTGYKTVDTSTYKDVLASTRPKGERWDMLESKLGKEADAKKKRYVKLYKPLDIGIKEKLKTAKGEKKTDLQNQLNYVRYSYYGIADKELAESEQYKKNLITGIRQTDAVTDDMKRGINKTPDDNKSEKEYKKMLLDELESEYDKEQADFKQTATEVQKRKTVFAQSSAVSRPNQKIVKLATQQRSNISRIRQPEINNNVPSPRQRGGGFKRFSKW